MKCPTCKRELQSPISTKSSYPTSVVCVWGDCQAYIDGKLTTMISFMDSECVQDFFFPIKINKTWHHVKPRYSRHSKDVLYNAYGEVMNISHMPIYTDDRFEQSYNNMMRVFCREYNKGAW